MPASISSSSDSPSSENQSALAAEPISDDGDSMFESAEEGDELLDIIELDSEALEALGETYFDEEVDMSDEELEEEEEYDSDAEIPGHTFLEEEDDDEEEGEDEEEDDDDEEDAFEEQEGLHDSEDELQALQTRRATIALLARLQGGMLTVDDENYLPGRRRSRPAWKRTVHETPMKEGIDLLNSGEFGEPPQSHTIQSARRFSCGVREQLLQRESQLCRRSRASLAGHFLPTSNGKLAVRYPARAYSGQFSQDGSFFYTCSQDFRVRLYDTTDPIQWKHYKTVLGSTGRWTITDSNLSPDNRFVAYSSITPVVYMARTAQDNVDEQEVLNFTGPDMMGYNNGIWSIRFSSDGREIVAGAGDRRMYVYDIETKQVVLGVKGHADDVNAVCFADTSSNVLFSGSDDCLIKVWDRRSMVNKKEAGTLPGHTEGITFISSKGDGRYVVSNGKDQTTKLWDIRNLVSARKWDQSHAVESTRFDYRHQEYPGNLAKPHPNDRSVMTYTGHAILKTLIRCGFSPAATTDQQYIYSGSDCGKVWIWNLDGTVNRVLDLSKAEKFNPPQMTGRRRFLGFGQGSQRDCIRDAAWHPTLPYMASTSWHAEMDAGSIYLHEFGESDAPDMFDSRTVLKSSLREPSYSANDFWM